MGTQEQTFDDSQLPEWAVHDESDQEELEAFFNSPNDRGKSGRVVAIPRGDADGPVVSGAGGTIVANVQPDAEVVPLADAAVPEEPAEAADAAENVRSEVAAPADQDVHDAPAVQTVPESPVVREAPEGAVTQEDPVTQEGAVTQERPVGREVPEVAGATENREEMDLFFNAEVDRGRSEAKFAIPRGVSGAPAPSGAAGPEPAVAQEPEPEPEPAVELAGEPQPAAGPEPEPAPEPAHAPEPEPAPAPVPQPAPALAAEAQPVAKDVPPTGGDGAVQDEPEASQEHKPSESPVDLARFRCIYESKDGRMALYEDENGHLCAVDTSRLS